MPYDFKLALVYNQAEYVVKLLYGVENLHGAARESRLRTIDNAVTALAGQVQSLKAKPQ